MARAAWTSALLAVMCLTSLARHHAAAAQPSPTASGGLGHRGLADRGRRRRRATGPTATACRARVVSQGGDAGRRVCDRAGLAGHARPVRRRGDREGRAHSLQPSSPSPSSCGRPKPWRSRATSGLRPSAHDCRARGSTACSPPSACRRRRPARRCRWWPQACARRRRRRWPGSTALVALTATAVRSAPVARGEGHPGGRTARRGALRHGQRFQRTRPRRAGEDRHRHVSGPEGHWASSSPHGPRARRRARSSCWPPASPARTPPTWRPAIVASPRRERRARAHIRRAKRGAPFGAKRRASAERSEAPSNARLGAQRRARNASRRHPTPEWGLWRRGGRHRGLRGSRAGGRSRRRKSARGA